MLCLTAQYKIFLLVEKTMSGTFLRAKPPLAGGLHLAVNSVSAPVVTTKSVEVITGDESNGVVVVQDEGADVGKFASMNFTGSGVSVTDAGSGVADVSVAIAGIQNLEDVLTAGNDAGNQDIVNLASLDFEPTSGIAIGTNTVSAQSTTRSIAIGQDCQSTVTDAICIGAYGRCSGMNSVAIGRSTNVSADYCVTLGPSTIASGVRAIAVGDQSHATAAYAIAIGSAARTNHANSVMIGRRCESTAENEFGVNVSGTFTESLRTTFATEGSAGAVTQYLTVNIKGTDYKIPLHALA